MRFPSALPSLRLLVAFTLLSPAGARAADIPRPAFYVKGDTVEDAGVPLALPTGTGTVEGKITTDGEALVFDGTGGTVTFEFDAQALFGNPFTISARVETIAQSGYGDIIQSAQPVGFGLRTTDHGNYSVSGGRVGGWNAVFSAPKSVRLGTTQHVAVTCTGNEVVIYVDGVESGRGQLEDIPKADNRIILGNLGRAHPNGDGLLDAPHARISRIAVFDSILSQEQITAIANGQEIPTK
ncbi:MAG: LamG domain-containing protein [Terrimicrobiaceae bacterium]|nr:LamG domain-containing protein [Terrimicrobiaceae bacterium]